MQVGETVGGYQLVRSLGEGPFGVVWQARDARGTPLAIKLLRPGFVQRPAGQAAFTRLLAALRAHEMIHHEGVARLYGPVHDAEKAAFGMACELVEGRLVSDIRMPRATDVDPKSLSVVLAWFENLGEMLGWLHAQGIVHGNLKPTNVKLVRETYGHRTKVLDLPWSSIGLAAPADGAPSYLAPEQLRGAPPSAYSDQWSVAKMLLDILSSERAGGMSALPGSLQMVLQRAHHPDPRYRFPQMMELVVALRGVRSELSRPPSAGYGAYPGPFGGGQPPGPFGGSQPPGPLGSLSGAPQAGGAMGSWGSLGSHGAEGSLHGAPAGPAGYPRAPSSAQYPYDAPPTGGLESAGGELDPVFVPTARSLGNDSAGGYPETGEHEALRFVTTSTPEAVNPSPGIEDRAPPHGAPSLAYGQRPAGLDEARAPRPSAQLGTPTLPKAMPAQLGTPTLPKEPAPGWPFEGIPKGTEIKAPTAPTPVVTGSVGAEGPKTERAAPTLDAPAGEEDKDESAVAEDGAASAAAEDAPLAAGDAEPAEGAEAAGDVEPAEDDAPTVALDQAPSVDKKADGAEQTNGVTAAPVLELPAEPILDPTQPPGGPDDDDAPNEVAASPVEDFPPPPDLGGRSWWPWVVAASLLLAIGLALGARSLRPSPSNSGIDRPETAARRAADESAAMEGDREAADAPPPALPTPDVSGSSEAGPPPAPLVPVPSSDDVAPSPALPAASTTGPAAANEPNGPTPASASAAVPGRAAPAAGENGPRGPEVGADSPDAASPPPAPPARAVPRPRAPPAGRPAATSATPPIPTQDAEDGETSALEEAQVGCDEGNAAACMEVVDHFRKVGESKPALAAARRACDFGNASGCLAAADDATVRSADARRLIEKGCTLRSAEACHRAALLSLEPTAAAAFSKRACDLGRKASCAEIKTSTTPAGAP